MMKLQRNKTPKVESPAHPVLNPIPNRVQPGVGSPEHRGATQPAPSLRGGDVTHEAAPVDGRTPARYISTSECFSSSELCGRRLNSTIPGYDSAAERDLQRCASNHGITERGDLYPPCGGWGAIPRRPRLAGRKAKRRGLFQKAAGRPRCANGCKPGGLINIPVYSQDKRAQRNEAPVLLERARKEETPAPATRAAKAQPPEIMKRARKSKTPQPAKRALMT